MSKLKHIVPRLLPADDHADLFVRWYGFLLSRALRLTDHRREDAEDLVHDVLVELALARTDLDRIENVEGYLFMTLRNIHYSQARRAQAARATQLSITDYDSAEMGLRSVVSRTELQVRELQHARLIARVDLERACQYAVLRKETSRAASVLILRFFHGYYPEEIAQITCASRGMVGRWLQVARREAKIYVSDPKRLRILGGQAKASPVFDSRKSTVSPVETMEAIREYIFGTRRGACLDLKRLQALYLAGERAQVKCETLAHVVSCAICLDRVNALLGLPLLSERYPTDVIGRDGGGSDDDPSAGGGQSLKAARRKFARRLREVVEHRPAELHIAVNGEPVCGQKVFGGLSEQTLNVELAKGSGFIEVLSEQGVRLLLLGVEGQAGEVTRRVELSDGRTLEATLRADGSKPTLHVTYTDPEQKAESAAEAEGAEASAPPPTLSGAKSRSPKLDKLGGRLWSFVKVLRGRFPAPRTFLRPGAVTTLFAVILIAALLFVQLQRFPTPMVSAAELLRRSTIAEETQLAHTDQVLHRTLQLEEKRATTGELIARRRVEVWHSAEKGITARRLYDEQGKLIAGDWRRSDGVQTLYQHGERPRLSIRNPQSAIRNREVWQLSPSAKDFTALVENADTTRVEERPTAYVITYGKEASAGAHGLVKATLTLSRPDLRAVEQTLLVSEGGEAREYRFTESSFERHTPSAVAPAVFEPEPELLGATTGRAEPALEPAKKEAVTPEPKPAPLARAVVSAELEVEVLRLLNAAGADTDDQTTVTRTPDGRLQVSGLVETEERRAEIMRALAPVGGNSAVLIHVETVEEAIKRQAKESGTASGTTSEERVEVTQARIPVYEELSRYLGSEGAQADGEVSRFAARALGRSRRALSHAVTLNRLASRFSPEEMRALTSEARSKWLAVLRAHAQAVEQETRALRQELRPVFFPGAAASDVGEEGDLTDEAELARVASRLLELSASNNRVILSAFTVSAEGSGVTAVKTPQFTRALIEAERLAARVRRAR